MELNNLAMNLNKRIAVLGAGPMGLATAFYLIKKGYCPDIYEADDRVGGMAASFDFNGINIERFYHYHCTSDDAYFEVLNDLKLINKFHWVNTKMGFYYNKSLQEWGNPFALLRFKGLSMLDKVRFGLHAFYTVKKNNYEDLDQISAIDWIKNWLGDSAYTKLWEKLFTYKFYDLSKEISAAWIWARVRRMGRSRYNLMHEKLGYLEGGSKTLLEELQEYIKNNGGQFFLKSPVQQIIIEKKKIVGIKINNKKKKYEEVISTIPIPYIPKIIPNLPSDIIHKFKAIKNVAVVCVIVKLRRPVSPYFWVNVNDEGMDIPGFVEYSNLRPMDNSIVYIPFYMPQSLKKFNDSDILFINKVKSYLIKINPKLDTDDFIDMHVSRYLYSQPICTPKFLQQLPPIDCGIKGLKIADTSYYYPEDRGISESFNFAKNFLIR